LIRIVDLIIIVILCHYIKYIYIYNMSSTKKNKITKRDKKNKTKKEKYLENKCANFFNTYTTFEDKFEKIYGDIFSSKEFNLEKTDIKELKKAVSPSNIDPRNDFYSYINEVWINKKQLDESQKYIVQIDDFRLVQDKVFKELIQIINEYIKNNNTKLSKQLKNFYKSQLKLNTDKKTMEYSNNILNKIDEIRKNGTVWDLLGFVNNNEIVSWGSPFSWSLNPDDKNPSIFRCYVDQPQLSLIDINIYFDDGTDLNYKKKYKNKYFKYLNDLFENSFGLNHNFNFEDIFLVEIDILLAMSCIKIKGEKASSTYNKITTKEALETYNFDWKSFSKSLGFNYTPDFFITSNLNYLKCGTELLLKEWNSEKWRTYWIYIFIRQLNRWNPKGRIISFDFLGNFVRGQEEVVQRELASIFSIGFAFNTFLTNEYIDKYQNEQRLIYVKTMAEDLKTVFIRIVKRNKWLQPETKEKALKKLYNFNLEVGSPKILREDPLLNYSDDDAWGNMLKIVKWRHDTAVKLEGKHVVDIPVMDWAQFPPKFIGTQAYVVNASYTPSKNGIYIPLGYIQKPFVDLEERGIEYNLAHIGFTLGHEMSHALDDWGSKYDETGKLNDWWTEEDKKKFEKIQKDVIKQYEVFASYDGIKFDAKPSIGEDLADISGLAICREYLRDFQIKNEDILPIKALSFEAFFVYFAYQQRQKISKKAIEAQLKTNPHPLDKYRTNVPLSRIQIFREMYKIKKGDKMWWNSTNKVWDE
jgi:putative endopeptidase